MPNPGLIFVTSEAVDPNKTPNELHNRFYNEELIPDMHSAIGESGFPQLALRYKNVNAESDKTYLLLIPVPDSQWTRSSEYGGMNKKQSKILGGREVAFDSRRYEKIQTFEGYGYVDKTGKDRGNTIVSVAMEPPEIGKQDFEDWYRKQHLDMLSMCRGYRRCTRYKRIDGETPTYLALHEYACQPYELPNDQIKQVSETEWTKKILAEAKEFERNVFELVSVHGDAEQKL